MGDEIKRAVVKDEIVRLQIEKIEALGWKCSRSTRDALRESLDALVSETRARRSA